MSDVEIRMGSLVYNAARFHQSLSGMIHYDNYTKYALYIIFFNLNEHGLQKTPDMIVPRIFFKIKKQMYTLNPKSETNI